MPAADPGLLNRLEDSRTLRGMRKTKLQTLARSKPMFRACHDLKLPVLVCPANLSRRRYGEWSAAKRACALPYSERVLSNQPPGSFPVPCLDGYHEIVSHSPSLSFLPAAKGSGPDRQPDSRTAGHPYRVVSCPVRPVSTRTIGHCPALSGLSGLFDQPCVISPNSYDFARLEAFGTPDKCL
jgi:hypothetical protein